MERYVPKKLRLIFYVYEHWRPDTDVCFYVGKGHDTRAQSMRKRNMQHKHIVNYLLKLGMCVEVRMVNCDLSEKEALSLEVARIAFWRSLGVELTNVTNGGDGTSGLVHSKETRAIIKAKRKKQKMKPPSEETKKKIARSNSLTKKGKPNPAHSARMKGRTETEEHKANISKGLLARNYSPSIETRAKIGNGNRGKTRSAKTIENLRVSHLNKKPSKVTIERRKVSIARFWEEHPEARLARSEATKRGKEAARKRKQQQPVED